MHQVPPHLASAVKRLKDRTFTDADVKTILIGTRETQDPIMRELGDLVAHNLRNRGTVRDLIVNRFGAMTLFIKYIGKDKLPFPTDGTCGWWLKAYLIGQTNACSVRIEERRSCKEILGVTPEEARVEISKCFDPNLEFPTKILRPTDRFYQLAQHFSRYIFPYPAFECGNLYIAIANCFSRYGIKVDQELQDDIVVCVSIMLSQATYQIKQNTHGKGKFVIGDFAGVRANTGRFKSAKDWVPTSFSAERGCVGVYGCFEPDGVRDKSVRFCFAILESSIRATKYLDPALFVDSGRGSVELDEEKPLQFDRKHKWRVTAAID